MKKVFAVLTIITFVLSLSACGILPIKKAPADSPPKKMEDEQKVQEPQTPHQIPHEKAEEGAENSKEPEENTDDHDAANQSENSYKELDLSGLTNEKIVSWMPARNKEHKVPVISAKYKTLLDKYGGYFTGDASSKVIYLTFDEGYEYGLTERILDILKANDVKAAFFATATYIKKNPELVKRMVAEGHIVGNHTRSHPDMPDLLASKGPEEVVKELTDTEEYFRDITGTDMPKFYRPPQGVWSEATLAITNSMGYKTILWSMAHKDWDVNNQPGREAAFKFVDTYYHNGAILLLHPQSQSNTEALQDIITNLKSKGYGFAPLTELD